MITETNPYVPPNTHGKLNEATEDHRPARGWGTILWSLAYFYPVLSTACIYSSWLTACICLGRMPRPMLDDPKSIGGIVDAAYMLSMIAILTAPIMIPLCFFSSLICPLNLVRGRVTQAVILGIGYIAITVGLILIIRFDPGRVLEWLAD